MSEEESCSNEDFPNELSLFVGNLNSVTDTAEQLCNLINKYTHNKDIAVAIKESDSEDGSTFGFVKFNSEGEKNKALSILTEKSEELMLNNRRIYVHERNLKTN